MTVRSARRIGLIGFGAIGRQIQAALSAAKEHTDVTVLLGAGSPSKALCPPGVKVVHSVDELVAAGPAAVVEAAGASAVRSHVPTLVAAGLPVIVSSVGALADDDLLGRLLAACGDTGGRVIVPGGALGGLDYLRAVAGLADLQVRYTSRKPVAAWSAELRERKIDPTAMHDEFVLFEGGPEEAARLYPRNLNAGLTVALAVGKDKVRVRVVADPRAGQNIHELEVTSAAGSASMRFANAPSPDNPKTSMLTALSILASLEPLLSSRPRLS
ncbi:MAG: aspartate dehydrogenase [Mesorhizobium sp.]